MVMSSGLHHAQGATGLRRLMLDRCRLRTLVKFDNEMRSLPRRPQSSGFDLIIFDKGGATETFDAAFFSRESRDASRTFRAPEVPCGWSPPTSAASARRR